MQTIKLKVECSIDVPYDGTLDLISNDNVREYINEQKPEMVVTSINGEPVMRNL
jgi:predicted RNase H-like nuclease